MKLHDTSDYGPASRNQPHGLEHAHAVQDATHQMAASRKYDLVFLDERGDIAEVSTRAPALPAFEDAFCAFGHGVILQTQNGPMAIEDLLPGDSVRLSDGTYDTLMWRGSTTLTPSESPDGSDGATLIRITADAFGPQRPAQDLVLGPSARLFHKANGIRALTGASAAFIPACDFIDGLQMIALRPAAPVRVYQLGFERHRTLDAGGIQVESLHPGTAFSLGLRGDMLSQYMALFPHKQKLEDFGTLQYPRLRLRDLDLFQAG